MNYKAWIKNTIKQYLMPVVQNQVDALFQQRLAQLTQNSKIDVQNSGPTLEEKNSNQSPNNVPFDLVLISMARNLAASGDHRIILPTDTTRVNKKPEEMKIGLFGNIANNAYNFVKCFRRQGYDAELVVEDGFFDAFLLNRPFWEDVEVECSNYEEGLTYEHLWKQPAYVQRVAYDPEMQMQYQKRYSAIPEVQEMYRQAFGIELPPDRALLLAQHMGHWPYLLAMKRYDIIQFSGAPICMGAFCPRPYVVFPTGSDLFISPFEETLFGLMMRVGYKKAQHIIFCETNYSEYLDRLVLSNKKTFCPLMIDTDVYCPGDKSSIREHWEKATGGRKFLLSVCRQAWEWKGNDRLICAFANYIRNGGTDWYLVLLDWGPDVAKTKDLISQLGLERFVLWENLSSKVLLRKKQNAADVVVDQFVMEGYGTSVLEAMAAGKPVIITANRSTDKDYLKKAPPFVDATSVEEICSALFKVSYVDTRVALGDKSLNWIVNTHSYRNTLPVYVDVYLDILK